MIGTAEQDAFIREHIYSVVTTLRTDGSPSNSVVFTLCDGDELFFSTTRDRLKAKTVEGDSRVAVTFLDDGAPHRFVTVEGEARIDGDNIIDSHVQINRALRGPDFDPPQDFAQRLAKQGRVIVRIRAERVSGVTER